MVEFLYQNSNQLKQHKQTIEEELSFIRMNNHITDGLQNELGAIDNSGDTWVSVKYPIEILDGNCKVVLLKVK